jgi:hypothetical protein
MITEQFPAGHISVEQQLFVSNMETFSWFYVKVSCEMLARDFCRTFTRKLLVKYRNEKNYVKHNVCWTLLARHDVFSLTIIIIVSAFVLTLVLINRKI